MTTYTCKCGKTFEGKGDSVTTGMRVPRADYTVDHFCFGCPFMKDVNVDFLECRGTRETPVYGTTASCVSSKASTLHVSSLDFDFIRDMSDFYNSLAVEPPKNTPTRGMEGGSGKYPFSFDFPKNNKGEKAKRELIDRFFAPVQGEDNYREMFYRKDISGWAEQINLYHKIRDAKEEAKAMSLQTETTAFVGTMYRHVGRVLHIGPSEEKFRTFFYFLEDPSDEIFLGALPKCDTPEIAQKMLDDYAARHDYEVYEPTSEAETPLESDLSSDDTPAEAAGEPEDNEPAAQPEQDDIPDSENDEPDPNNNSDDPDNDQANNPPVSCDWQNASGADEDEEMPDADIPSGQPVSLRDSVFDEIINACDAKINSALRVMLESHQRKFDFTAKISFELQGDMLAVTHETGYKFEPINYKDKKTLYEDIQIVLGADGNPMIPYDREHQINFDEIQPGRVIPPSPVTTTVDGNTGLVEDVQIDEEDQASNPEDGSNGDDAPVINEFSEESPLLIPCDHQDCPFYGTADDGRSGCLFDTESKDDINFAGDVWTAVNMENCQRIAVLQAYRKNNPEEDYDESNDFPDDSGDLPFDVQEIYEEDSAS